MHDKRHTKNVKRQKLYKGIQDSSIARKKRKRYQSKSTEHDEGIDVPCQWCGLTYKKGCRCTGT